MKKYLGCSLLLLTSVLFAANKPALFTATKMAPTAIAVDQSFVYWGQNDANSGAIYKLPKDGHGDPTLVVDNLNEVSSLVVHGDYLYWADDMNNNISRIKLDGKTPELLVDSTWYSNQIVIDDNFIYWTQLQGAAVPGSVLKVPLAGGKPTVLVPLLSDLTPQGIAIDKDYVYFGDLGASRANEATGRVLRVSKQGGGFQVLATKQNSPNRLVISGSVLYWLNDDSFQKLDLLVMNNVTLQDGLNISNDPSALAVDSMNVYFPSSDNEMDSAALQGDAVAVLGHGDDLVNEVSDIASDNQYVYWANGGGKSIVRVSK